MKVYIVTETYEHDGYGETLEADAFSTYGNAVSYCKSRMIELKKKYDECYEGRYIVDNDGKRIRPDDSVCGDVDDITLDIWEKEIM